MTWTDLAIDSGLAVLIWGLAVLICSLCVIISMGLLVGSAALVCVFWEMFIDKRKKELENGKV